jgi:hypothetical protein
MSLLENNAFNSLRYTKLLGVLLLIWIVITAVYQNYNIKFVYKNGIYSKCKVIDVRGYKGGTAAYIEYYFQGKTYATQLANGTLDLKIDSQYLIKFLPSNPKEYVVIADTVLPDCLKFINPPFNGWNTIPQCLQK